MITSWVTEAESKVAFSNTVVEEPIVAFSARQAAISEPSSIASVISSTIASTKVLGSAKSEPVKSFRITKEQVNSS